MSTRTFALIFGIVFLAVGVLGFVPGLVQPLHEGHPAVMGHGGQLLGLFPINEVHNGVHVLFGLWGLAASRSPAGAVTYARGVALIYALLTVFGFIPNFQTLFGLAPLYGNDIWLHAALALVAAYFGWVHRNPVTA
ncbi:MAG: DUF4383 domain-containing protein [Allosphingosinicella sp.]